MKKIFLSVIILLLFTGNLYAANPVTYFLEAQKAVTLSGYVGSYIGVKMISAITNAFKITSVDLQNSSAVLDNDNSIYGDATSEQIHFTYNQKAAFPASMFVGGEPSGATFIRTLFLSGHDTSTQAFTNTMNTMANDTRIDFCVFTVFPDGDSMLKGYSTDGIDQTNPPFPDPVFGPDGFYQESPVPDGVGNYFSGLIDSFPIEFYDNQLDVPASCYDGIQNQDETGIDCGGVCFTSFGLDCPPAETCFDRIQNQDETGIDYGGVCGKAGDESIGLPPVSNFTDSNQDNIDDISGTQADGSIPVGVPTLNTGTYNGDLPGDVAEIGDTDWSTLIMDYIVTSPIISIVSGASINLAGAECSLSTTIYGKNVVIDFCSLQSMVDFFGTVVLVIFTLRSLFIALGVD